jgi:hypothetical protein
MKWRKTLWWVTGFMQFIFLWTWGIDAVLTALGFGFGFVHHNDKTKLLVILILFFLLWLFFRTIRRPFRKRYRLGMSWDWIGDYIRSWKPLKRNEKEMRDITP